MTETQAAPIMLRADITRAELKALKTLAVERDMTVQALVATILRKELAA
jgi:hypothetical protein